MSAARPLTRGLQSCMLGAALAGGCASPQTQVAHQGSDLLAPASSWSQQGARPAAPTTAAIPTADGTVVPVTGLCVVTDRPASATPAAAAAAIPPVVYADKPAGPTDGNTQPATTLPPLNPNQLASAKLIVVVQSNKGVLKAGPRLRIGLPGHAYPTIAGWSARCSLRVCPRAGGSVTPPCRKPMPTAAA